MAVHVPLPAMAGQAAVRIARRVRQVMAAVDIRRAVAEEDVPPVAAVAVEDIHPAAVVTVAMGLTAITKVDRLSRDFLKAIQTCKDRQVDVTK